MQEFEAGKLKENKDIYKKIIIIVILVILVCAIFPGLSIMGLGENVATIRLIATIRFLASNILKTNNELLHEIHT